MKDISYILAALVALSVGCQEAPSYTGGQERNPEEDQGDTDLPPDEDLRPAEDLPPDLPPTEDVPPAIDICEDFCPAYVCRGGAVYACTQSIVGCGSPCPCDAPVDEAVCGEPCQEGASGQRLEDLCGPVMCLCASDADCGQQGVACQDCQCVPQGDGLCLETCAQRRNRELGEGFCPPDWMGEGSCEGACANFAGEADDVREAGLRCLREDPLCFQSLSDCLYLQLHGQEARARFQVRGAGFERWEGASVAASFVVGDGPQPVAWGEVRSGRWAVEWDGVTWPGPSSQAVIWVDADGDGICNGQEPVQWVALQRGELIRELVYEGEADPNAEIQAQLCEWF